MRISRKLYMVFPMTLEDGSRVDIHSTPIGLDTFKTYHDNLSRTFTKIYTGGHGIITGPRIAAMLLEKDAKEYGNWEGDNGIQKGLLEEIWRLSNGYTNTNGQGWKMTPLAAAQDYLTEEEWSEVQNAIVYFTVASAIHRRTELKASLEAALSLWGPRVELLNATEYLSFLQTSMKEDNTGEKVIPSSIPS